MATIINTPPNIERPDNTTGWTVAIIVLLLVIGFGTYFWMNSSGTSSVTNINAILPASGTSSTSASYTTTNGGTATTTTSNTTTRY